MAASILVYADWDGLSTPIHLGLLHARSGAGRELFEFEFQSSALAHPAVLDLHLDPRIGLFEGGQFPPSGFETFGVFADASPDRWGRLLLRRRLERDQRAGRVGAEVRLRESDYLLGVHDAYRSGALRFRLGDSSDFLDNRESAAAPPFVRLRALQAASLALERDEANTAAGGDEWLRMLIAPGASLGGARPKASVEDPDGHLWIAKFPSVLDDHDVGGWELVVNTLAQLCGLRVPESLARRFANRHHTFLARRFDRTAAGRRLHYASAMNLTGRHDGDDASTGASYLELARVLVDHGARTDVDLTELWSRIVFNLLVSNSDDHLRNHGFVLEPTRGWRLAEAFDLNPVPESSGLTLNISEADNAMDLELVLSVAHLFRVKGAIAKEIVERSRGIVRQWPRLARSLRISTAEQERMAPAFRLAA